MAEYLPVIASAEAVIIVVLLFLYLEKVCNPPEKKREKAWRFERQRSKDIEITNINIKDNNSWDDPQICLWLASPMGHGIRMDDKRLPLEGRIINPPPGSFVRVQVLLSPLEIWPQGDYPVNEKGEWRGWIYLSAGEGEEYKKVIRVELCGGIGENLSLIHI